MASTRKAALVTGAANGIGRSAAIALAKAGYDVAINYSRSDDQARETEAECKKAGATTMLLRSDVADETGVRAMLKEIETTFGRLDALVNNAGITHSAHPKDFENTSLEEWDRVFAVNVRGIFQVTRACIPLLKAAPAAAIVNTASIVGLRPGPQPLAYAASKAAVISLTKTLALNLGPKIRVNAVAPGWMEGDWMKRMLKDHYEDLMGRRAKATPLKRCVTADDVAETMLSLIESNHFVTGEIVIVDGGFAQFDLTARLKGVDMLEGVVPFPPDFAARYRAKGYWQDKSLRDEFDVVFKNFGPRVCIIDRDRQITYAELDALSTNLALNLLELGFKPLDRVVPTLPNVAEFVILYFALQKIGCIPIAALATHRYSEVSQFVRLSQAVACIYPERQSDFEFAPMVRRVREESPFCKFAITMGKPAADELSLQDLINTPAKLPASELGKLKFEPTDPCIFQLSGGTTGIPKLIPRTHNDYAYNSKRASEVCGVSGDSVLLLMLPIAHNLPLACPGIQGFMFNGGKIVLSQTTRPEEIFPIIAKHRVSHIKVVPALLIRLINSPEATKHDTSSVLYIQSGGQRLQPETRHKTKELIPTVFVQENFGMSEGMLLFAKIDDPEPVRMETVGFPVCEDDEVRLVDDDDNVVPFGEVGEFLARGPYTLRGYYGTPEHNAKAFTSDGFYRSGDLMRQHPSGAYLVEGRKKDLINRGGEKISAEEVENLILSHPAVQNVACVAMPDPDMGERMCACVILHQGATLTLPELLTYLQGKEIAKYKMPERLEIMNDFPLSKFGKVAKNVMVEMIAAKVQKK